MKVYKTANSCCFVKLHKQKLCTKDTLSFCHYLFCLLLHFPLLNLAYIGLNFNTELRLFSEVESEHPLVPAMNILLPRKLNYHVLYISSSVWLLRTPNAGGGNLLSPCFLQVLARFWWKNDEKLGNIATFRPSFLPLPIYFFNYCFASFLTIRQKSCDLHPPYLRLQSHLVT